MDRYEPSDDLPGADRWQASGQRAVCQQATGQQAASYQQRGEERELDTGREGGSRVYSKCTGVRPLPNLPTSAASSAEVP